MVFWLVFFVVVGVFFLLGVCLLGVRLFLFFCLSFFGFDSLFWVVFVSSVLFSSFFVFPILIWGKALRAAFLGIPPDPLFGYRFYFVVVVGKALREALTGMSPRPSS